MKLAFLTTLALPVASSASSESYLRKAIHQLFAAEQLANIGTTPCTYFSVDNDEGCGTDDMCKISTGHCMLRSASQEGVCITPPEICTAEWDPVCGCDGVSYSNECDALSSGVNVMNVGCCTDDEDCEDNIEDSFTSADEATTPCTYFSVDNDEGCGTDDMCKIATGNCMLRSASQEGVCITPPEMCTYDFNPVCGCDGVSYSNECDALGAGVNVMNVGCCPDDEDCEDNIEDSFTSADEATTPCTYFNADNDEGCGAGDMCKIAMGNCMLMIASQEGVCITPPEMCTYDFNPVCGCDGVSYSNECVALGSGVNVMNVGCCPDDEDCEDNIEDSSTSADEATTPCTYFNADNDEGCGAGDMCKIATGNCMLMIASQEGVCITPPEMCTYDFNPVCGCDGVSYSNECDALGSGVNVQFPGCCPDDEECQTKLA